MNFLGAITFFPILYNSFHSNTGNNKNHPNLQSTSLVSKNITYKSTTLEFGSCRFYNEKQHKSAALHLCPPY